MDQTASEHRFGLAMAAVTSILWGFLAIALEVTVQWVPVTTIVWFRFLVAFLVLAAVLGSRDRRRLTILRRMPRLGVLAAVALTGNYLAYLAGLDMTSPSNAQVLIQIAPVLLAGVGVVVFKEQLSRRQMIWVLVVLSGMGLFYRDQLAQLVGTGAEHLSGNLWILLAAVVWTTYAALQKFAVRGGEDPQELNLVLYLVPAVLLAPFADLRSLAALSPGQWTLMVFLAANTLLAYGALGEALKRLPAHEVSLIIVLNPLITLVVMAVLTALEVSWIAPDRTSWVGYLAALLVMLGVWGVLRKPRPAAPATVRS
jgi:drug/metabolite transporter (DMT)-like permease